MAKKKHIHQAFLLQLIWIGVVSTAAIGYLWISSELSRFENEIKTQKKEYIELQKSILKREVESAYAFVEHLRLQTDTRLRQSLKERVNEAYATALYIYQENEDRRDIPEIKTRIKQALRPIRFKNNRGYYFIFDLNGIERLLPVLPEMEGRYIPGGGKDRSAVREILQIIHENKEGFYRYNRNTTGKRGDLPEVTFVKLLEPLGWVIGSGENIEDVMADIQKECIDYISRIRFGRDGYIFAGQYDGLSLSGPAKGRNMLHVEDAGGVKIVQELIKAAKSGGGFVHYVLPRFEGRKNAPKISYAVGVPEWQWYVGAGVYVDEIENVIAQKRVAQHKQIKRTIAKIVLILLLLLFFIGLTVKMLSDRMHKNLALFIQFFDRASTGAVTIETDRLHFTEFEKLAESANKMVEKQKKTEKDLQASHQRFLTVLDSIDATIYVADMETYEVLFMNQYMKKAFNGDQTGKSCFEVFRNETGPCLECSNKELLDENQNPTGLKIWQDKNPVTGRWYVNYDRAIEWTDGRLVKLQIATDITEFKKLENELHQAHKMESIGTLAGGIAHEFNNILSIIIGNIEICLDDIPSGSPGFENIEKIRDASMRARDIVKQLLSFSRKADQNRESLDIVSVVEDSLKLVRSSTPSNIEIKKDIAANLPNIFADQTQIHQIVINLCTNASHALAHTEKGVIEIRLDRITLGLTDTRYRDMPPGDYIELVVRDNGTGMPPDLIDKIFDPYFTTKAMGHGTGMGLAVVHGITQNHGGAIVVDSEPLKGTAFYLIFPVTSQKNRQRKDVGGNDVDLAGQGKILFVDDEKEITNILTRYLNRSGYKVVSSNDPEQALSAFKKTPAIYDMIISDMTMPQMNGLTFAKEIRAVRKDIPIVICTGYSSQIDDEKIREIGIAHVAMKPLRLSELTKLIKNTLKKSRLNRG